MRGNMQQKVQSACRGTESRPPDDVGEFPSARQTDPSVPHGAHSAPPDQTCRTTRCDERVGADTCGCRCAPESVPRKKCGLAAGILILLIKVYQKTLSPLTPACCRFYPSCSNYALEALRLHGFMRGTVLTVWRIVRCNPWCPGGYDPVPPPKSGKNHNEV